MNPSTFQRYRNDFFEHGEPPSITNPQETNLNLHIVPNLLNCVLDPELLKVRLFYVQILVSFLQIKSVWLYQCFLLLFFKIDENLENPPNLNSYFLKIYKNERLPEGRL